MRPFDIPHTFVETHSCLKQLGMIITSNLLLNYRIFYFVGSFMKVCLCNHQRGYDKGESRNPPSRTGKEEEELKPLTHRQVEGGGGGGGRHVRVVQI